MNSKIINGITIYRPNTDAEASVYNEIRIKLLNKYNSKKYKESGIITEILNFQFASYEELIDRNLKVIVSRSLVEFLCHQYDQYSLVEQDFKDDKLSIDDNKFWNTYGNLVRRGIKYLLELSTCIAIEDMNTVSKISHNEIDFSLSTIFIAVEELTRAYISSDQTHILFPNHTILKIDDKEFNYLDLTTDPAFKFDVRKEAHLLTEIVGMKNILTDVGKHNEIIGSSFQANFGIDYATIIGKLYQLIDNAQPDPNGLPVCFISYNRVIDVFSEQLNISKDSAMRIIDGFSLYRHKMIHENRKIYNPKQNNRALKRGFFVYPHESGDHLLFSKTMAKECLLFLFSDVPFKNIPLEWMSPKIKIALDNLSNKVGTWFERKVAEELSSLGVTSILSIKKIKRKDNKSKFIPADVGEIDIIAYSESDRTLIILECKLAKFATEPKFFRNDMHSFIHAKKSYKSKFIKKYKWVADNFTLVSDFAVEKLSLKTEPNKLGFAMVTFHPTIASKFIDDFSCISISELISNYKEEKKWQFSYLNIKK